MKWVLLIAMMAVFVLSGCGSKYSKTIEKIDQLLKEGNVNQALEALNQELRKDPTSQELLHEQVRFFLKTGQVEFAVAAHRKLIDKYPEDKALLEALEDSEPKIKVSAIRSLGLLKESAAQDSLINMLSDSDKTVRKAAIIALGDMKSKKASASLRELLKDKDWAVRGEAALALGKTGDVQASQPLFELLDDQDSFVADSVRKALESLADSSNRSLYLSMLQSSSISKKFVAAVLLGKIRDKSGIPVLLDNFDKAKPADQIAIIRVLAQAGGPEVLPKMRDAAAKSKNQYVRFYAILALGALKDTTSVEMLKRTMNNTAEVRDIRLASARALQLIEGQPSSPR